MIFERKVLEIGAETGIKEQVLFKKPTKYIGTNNSLRSNDSNTFIVSVYDVVYKFGKESFDFVYATEVLEHLSDWRLAIDQLKLVTAFGGYLFLTTRSEGYPFHGGKYGDYWRFNVRDFELIFEDFDIIALEEDNQYPGVLFIGRKSKRSTVNLNSINLYSIITKKRESIVPKSYRNLYFRFTSLIRSLLWTLLQRMFPGH